MLFSRNSGEAWPRTARKTFIASHASEYASIPTFLLRRGMQTAAYFGISACIPIPDSKEYTSRQGSNSNGSAAAPVRLQKKLVW